MKNRQGGRLGSAIVLLTALGIIVALVCVDDLHLMPRPATARRVLESFGYTGVRITGVHPLDCARGEPFRTGFAATSMAGKRVRGTVCQGWFQGAVIRLD